ncbi:transposase [candidate division KSB1 bacterium]|nr:transposase [candidate division KSB1 bacterium]
MPGANNSNKKTRNKSGNKDGNKYLKLAFSEAAFHAIRHYPEIMKFYNNKKRKKT